MDDAYRIIDEPRRGRLDRFVTNPIWPFFGLMMGGTVFGLPWFVFNGVALGSATLRREIVWSALCLPIAIATFIGLRMIIGVGLLPPRSGPYLGLILVAWKLVVGYSVFNLQRRSFALWEHYGGQPRRAYLLLIAAFVLRDQVLSGIGDWDLVFG